MYGFLELKSRLFPLFYETVLFLLFLGDLFLGGWVGGGGWWRKALRLLLSESLCQKVSVFVVFVLTLA